MLVASCEFDMYVARTSNMSLAASSHIQYEFDLLARGLIPLKCTFNARN